MSKLGLLSAGFSAILGQEVVLQEGGATLSIHDVFKETYVMKPPGYRPPSRKHVHGTFPIFVRDFFGFDELAPQYDYDLTDEKDDGKQYMRGGFEYN